jgi:hypothetical protein
MARVQNTLIGKSSGSVGGATFSTWKGLNVLKSKAISVANPNTVPQQTQRNRLTLMVSIFRQIAGVVEVGFKNLAIGKSEYNAFMSTNLQDATLAAAPPVVTFVPADMLTAKGTMGTTPIDNITATDASANVSVDWDDTLTPLGSSPTDELFLVVYNGTQDIWGIGDATGVTRADGNLVVAMPAPCVAADVIHAYLFFKTATSDVVSDSTYLTEAAV